MGLVLTKLVSRQLHCVFVQVVIFPIFPPLVLCLMRKSLALTRSPLILSSPWILLHRSQTYKERLVKQFYPHTYKFITLARDFFLTQRPPSGVSFPSIATVYCLLVPTMASQS